MMGQTTENSNLQCDGRSKVPVCPEMTKIITVTCSGDWDGSDDNVQLEFTNRYSTEESCITDYLAKNNHREFARGTTDNWSGGKLGTCNGNRFRPINGLWFRFHTNTWGWNPHHDQLRLCRVTAHFGLPSTPGHSVW